VKHLKTRKARNGSTLWYYQANGRQIPLKVGTLEEAKREIERYTGGDSGVKMFAATAEDYRTGHLPKVSPATRLGYDRHIDTLITAFGSFALDDIRPMHVRQYLDRRTKKTAGNREVSVLSHLWNWARQKGFTDLANPCLGVDRNRQCPRSRYVTDDEYLAVWERADPTLRDAMDLMLLTGQRPSDVLRMTRQDIRDGHLWVTQSKTGAKVGIEVVGDLAAVVARILTPGAVASLYLISDEHGQPLNVVQLGKRFSRVRAGADWQLRDLRAKAATESPDLKTAQQLLGHRTEITTAGIYRRVRGNVVKPLR
jgi:integrase